MLQCFWYAERVLTVTVSGRRLTVSFVPLTASMRTLVFSGMIVPSWETAIQSTPSRRTRPVFFTGSTSWITTAMRPISWLLVSLMPKEKILRQMGRVKISSSTETARNRIPCTGRDAPKQTARNAASDPAANQMLTSCCVANSTRTVSTKRPPHSRNGI